MFQLMLFRFFGAVAQQGAVGTPCTVNTSDTLFGLLKPWYYYLTSGRWDSSSPQACIPSVDLLSNINQLWLIGLALLDDLLAIAGFAAVALVIYGGIRFITSSGNPEHAKAARGTVINALIGLAIVSVAIILVNFLAGYLSQ